MRMTVLRSLILAGSCLGLVACANTFQGIQQDLSTLMGGSRAAVETEPVPEPMAPAPMPSFNVGDAYEYRFGGHGTQREEVVSAQGDTVTWRIPSGASWTTKTGSMFNTSRWFGSANYGDGVQWFSGETSALFPLRVGKSIRYTAKGESTETPEGWELQWTCTVPSQERIKVAAGTFDTFKVICHRDVQTRTYYYAPQVGMYVMRITTGRNQGVKELVSYRKAGG